jgi:hypothetical protein
MCSHAEWQPGKGPEGRKIGGLKGCAVGIDHRQPVVAVGGCAAVPGQVLEHREYAAQLQAFRNGFGDGRDLFGLAAIGTITYDLIATRHRHISNRQTVNVDAK